MAKRTTQKLSPSHSGVSPVASIDLTRTQLLAVLGVVGVTFYFYSLFSDGFYQDDEVSHFQRAELFFENPLDHLGNWSKFGFKLIYAVPALFGFKALLIFNILVTLATAAMAYLAARSMMLKHPALVLFFMLAQPMLIDLSFRNYSELLTGFLFALLVYLYTEKHFMWAAFVSSYLFMIRQETALMSLILGGIFFLRKDYRSFLILGFSPILLVGLGYLKTGDWFYIIKDAYAAGVEAKFKRSGGEHYPLMLISIIGAIPFSFFLVGVVHFLAQSVGGVWERLKAGVANYDILYIIFIPFFAFQCLSTSTWLDSGVNPGNLRYMIALSPLFALFALIGFNSTLAHASKGLWHGFFFAGVSLFTLAFCSRVSNLFTYTSEPEWSKFIAVSVLTAMTVMFLRTSLTETGYTRSVLLIGLVSVPFLLSPLKLTPENECIKTYVAWTQESYSDRRWLSNHSLVQFFAGIKLSDTLRSTGMRKADIERAPIGSIILWDTHYSFRPEYKMDVPYEYLQQHKDALRFLKQFNSSDNRFACLIFEKVAHIEPDSTGRSQ